MRDERKIDYTGIYDYAIANQLNYNELCAVVQKAVNIPKKLPRAMCPGCGCDITGWNPLHKPNCPEFPL